ncbi:hypothetical protein AB8B21_31505 [Tardiphaga sp. 866_E4_N2_1]|uniref:hypothetical protein n=1 Tax=unclassified Tardiphaga TaxID=2631404 RepID=UPI003F278540
MTTKMKTVNFKTADLVEVVADGTSVGKSTIANRLCHLIREKGRPVTLVRVETGRRQTAETGAADREVYIRTEDFATAANRTGGLSGVLTALWEEILGIPRTKTAVVVDWAGGSSAHRLDVLASTGFDVTLEGLGVRGLSMVVSTSSAESMTQAGTYLSGIEKVAPGLQRALVLSGRSGNFDFPPLSEQAETLTRLRKEAGEIPTVTIPRVAGRALETCADAGLDVATAMMMDGDALARRLGIDLFRSRACASELALWWSLTGKTLSKLAEDTHAHPTA